MNMSNHNFTSFDAEAKPRLDHRDVQVISEHAEKSAPMRWFNNLKLAKKLQTIFGTFAGFLFIISLVLWLGLSNIYDRYMVSTEIEASVLHSAHLSTTISEVRQNANRAVFRDKPASLQKSAIQLEKADEELTSIEGTVTAHMADNLASVAATRSNLDSYQDLLKRLEKSFAANSNDQTKNRLAAELEQAGDVLTAQSQSLEGEMIAGMKAYENVGLDIFYTLMATIALLLVLALLAVTTGFRILVKDFAGKIQETSEGMTALANGSQDFKISGTQRKDEVGEMARAMVLFKRASQTLKNWAQERTDQADEALAQQAEIQRERENARAKADATLADLAAQFERTVGEVVSGVATASSQLQSTASSMAETADETSRQTTEVATSIKEANAGATSAAAASDEFAMSIGEISRQAASSAQLARQATTSANEADKTISELSASAEQVGEIVELIHTIAQRTNLLALNASIEAARGGESGRGFAVVASEVKELAMQTSRATDQVSDQIRAMQDTTGASVSALRSIASQVEQLESTSVSIATAVDQQSVAGQDLARSIDLAARGSERVSANIEEVRTLSISTGAAASQVLASSTDLERQAATLRQQAQQFLDQIRRV